MEFPVRPEDVKIVQGASGKGLQITCSCGCVNWNHLEVQTSTWVCRNCGRIISHYFPGLVVKALEIQKPETESAPSPAPA
jgi:hypothetical protein